MVIFSRQISPEKWGIYSDTELLATVSCQQTCETIMANLKNGRRDTPGGELNSLYQVPKLRPKTTPIASADSDKPLVSKRKGRKKGKGAKKPPQKTTADIASKTPKVNLESVSAKATSAESVSAKSIQTKATSKTTPSMTVVSANNLTNTSQQANTANRA